jgi:hypothetical protein
MRASGHVVGQTAALWDFLHALVKIERISARIKEHISMIINEISADDCRAVLERASVGRLGCALNNEPYVVPIYLAFESDYIYVFSTFGKKIEWMRENPKVCVEVEESRAHPLSPPSRFLQTSLPTVEGMLLPDLGPGRAPWEKRAKVARSHKLGSGGKEDKRA